MTTHYTSCGCRIEQSASESTPLTVQEVTALPAIQTVNQVNVLDTDVLDPCADIETYLDTTTGRSLISKHPKTRPHSDNLETICVRGSDNVTADLQARIDAAGSRIHILFDTPACTLYNLTINNKEFVRMSSCSKTTLFYPAQTIHPFGIGADQFFTAFGFTREVPQITWTDCDCVLVDGFFEVNGSLATFPAIDPNYEAGTGLTEDGVALQSSWRIETTTGPKNFVHVEGVRFTETYHQGLRILNTGNNGTLRGYNVLDVSNVRGFDIPHGTVQVNGQHDFISIRRIMSEDPFAKASYHTSSSIRGVSIAGFVNNTGDLAIKKASIEDVVVRWGQGSVMIQQGCEHSTVDNVYIEGLGLLADGTDDGHVVANGSKTDNVFYGGSWFNRVSRFYTIGSKAGSNSFWVGQAGDANLKFTDCHVDGNISFNGTFNSTNTEGHSRFGLIENCIIGGQLDIAGKGGQIRGCRFMNLDPVLDPDFAGGRTEDDIFAAYPYTIRALRVVGADDGITVDDCDFVGRGILLNGDSRSCIRDCRFTFNGRIQTDNNFAGECDIVRPVDLEIVGSFSTAATAGTLRVFDPKGTRYANQMTGTINGAGPGGPITVERYDTPLTQTFTASF